MSTAADLIAWARSQIGVTESPAGSNRVRYWDDVKMPQGQPWCAAFYLAGLEAIGVGPVTRSVYVPTIEADYRRAGRFYPLSEGQPGDQIIYNIGDGHTGVLVDIDPKARTVRAIEGNTSSGVAGSQNNGGGVYERTRSWSLVIGLGRPAFDPPKPPSNPTEATVLGYLSAIDPDTDGIWFCDPAEGAIYAFARDGSTNGARNLGQLNTHPEWHAGVASNPVVGFDNWKDDSGQPAYQIWTREPGTDKFHRYAFPADGSAR